jgi:hypothetical protein
MLADLRNNMERGAPMEPDDRPTLDDAAIDKMLRLKRAMGDGTFDDEFDKLFPPEPEEARQDGEK